MRKSDLIREPLAIPLREAKAPLVLSVDVGTSGLRSFLFDVAGRPVASATAHRDRPVRTSTDGEASLDAGERVRATASAIDETLARAGRRAGDIAAVAFSTFLHSVLGVDERGRPTTRVVTWADTPAPGAPGTGLTDTLLRTWAEPLLAPLGVPSAALSPISDEPQTALRREFARRWPALARVPWVPAIGDGACSNVGAGAVGRDVAAIFLGTSGAIRVLFETDDPPVVSGGWTYHLDPRRGGAGGAASNAGG